MVGSRTAVYTLIIKGINNYGTSDNPLSGAVYTLIIKGTNNLSDVNTYNSIFQGTFRVSKRPQIKGVQPPRNIFSKNFQFVVDVLLLYIPLLSRVVTTAPLYEQLEQMLYIPHGTS